MSAKFLISMIVLIALSALYIADDIVIPTPTPKSPFFSPLSEVDEIARILTIPASCDTFSGVFSPDGTLFVANDGVYEIPSGKMLFEISGTLPQFSPDGTMLAVQTDSVYSIPDANVLFPILQASSYAPQFSPNGKLLAVANDGVYDVTSGEFLFPIFEGAPIFSPDGMLLAAGYHSYDVKSGELFLGFRGHFSGFTNNGTLGLVTYDGLYNMHTKEKRFDIPYGSTWLSPDGRSFALMGQGSSRGSMSVYNTTDGYLRFSTQDGYPQFSPDSSLLAIGGNGIYDTYTGQLEFAISNYAHFSPDGKLLAVSGDGIYDIATGELRLSIFGEYAHFSLDGSLLSVSFSNSCVIYGEASRGVQPPSITGAIYLKSGMYIRSSPSNNAPALYMGIDQNTYLVFARTSDNKWFKIGDNQWLSAIFTEIISLPDNLPVEGE